MSHPSPWPDTACIDPRTNPVQDAVAVYLLELEIPAPMRLAPHYLAYLGDAQDELQRAMRPAQRQWQYLQSRVLRRVVLGAYAGREPGQLQFARDDCGRMRLTGQDKLHFSLSQCASHVALAVGDNAVLGIDLETIYPIRPNFMQIARSHFSAADLDQLTACPAARRYFYFLELWTLKQAYLKSLGLGLHKPMADCTFTRAASGLIVCRDQAPSPGRAAADAFVSQQWASTCQLGLAHRDGLPVSFRYLNGSSMDHIWPHAEHDNGSAWQPTRAMQPLSS
ncbi:MAG: 4'-phosphopantetheinyl transferase superfamily protein [Duganella sp.]